MNDITKARSYLTKRNSKLRFLESFGLMYLTAEKEYKNLRESSLKQEGVLPENHDEKETEAAVDYAVLLYMKRHSILPRNVSAVFRPGISTSEKYELAKQWVNS